VKKLFTLLCSVLFAISSPAQLIINEVLYDPSNSGLAGDANGDGVYDQEEDSFIEFVNAGNSNFDASGYQIWDDTSATGSLRFVVPAGTFVPPNGAMVVFGSGPLVGTFGGAVLLSADTTSSHLNLNNSGEVIGIKDASGAWVLFFDSDALSNNPNESYTRFPDITGAFLQHADTTSILFSPGTRTDGTPFSTSFVVESISVQSITGSTDISTNLGTLQLSSTVLPSFASDMSVTWSVGSGAGSATVDANGLVSAIANGNIWIVASSNDGTNISDSIEITITNQAFSLEEFTSLNVELYPNPAENYIHLKTANKNIDEIRLMDISGALIQTYIGRTEEIDISHLSKGTYLLHLSSGNKVQIIRFQKGL